MVWAAALLALAVDAPLHAQYLGEQQPGFTGLKAGSQMPPGLYVPFPLYYSLQNISVYDPAGNQLARNVTGDINLLMLPSVQFVTPYKFFGVNIAGLEDRSGETR